ncbi:phosphatidylcholine-hydrolyzing phospholipase C [Fusarium albosuccineum]|uniref:Phosphatidylcholine-hydrolyzing phospholipase C n=1 Tax=Fusarium albosuccineum TaxID=1237068 RepID=A0A8H4LAS8_9HYPO|nr:phosphatidylcholine-hydrolyzing phospholipase C [Fusarium albosuccineum]
MVDYMLEKGDSVARAYLNKASHKDDSHDFCHIPTDKEFNVILYEATHAVHKDDAVMAYCVGHTRSLEIAREASNMPASEKKTEKLRLAYIYEPFAAHYLTDIFSAGHLRSPRRQMHTTHNYQMSLAGLRDVPIWDMQNRYMHDDDSATGIIVRNDRGDQWIEYGDKQFFEPQAVVNPARCMHCLTESVRGVYRVGFASTKSIGTWSDNKSWFAATKLVPQPMTAISPSSWLENWGGYDMHNPAPLCVSSGGGPDVESGWTLRKDINDHSNFGPRANGSLKNAGWTSAWPQATPQCVAVKDAKFRAGDQFPVQSDIRGLLSGGLVQIQDLNPGQAGKGLCINFWGPVEVPILDKSFSTWTLRNRLIDQTASPRLGEHVIHWMRRGSSGRGAGITGLAWAEHSDGSGDIVTKTTLYGAQDFGVSDNGDSVQLDLSKSWALQERLRTEPCVILGNLQRKDCVNLARFATGFFLAEAESQSDEKDLVVLAQIRNKGFEVGVESLLLEKRVAQFHVDGETDKAPFGFVKKFRGSSSPKDSVLLARGILGGYTVAVNFVNIDFDNTNQPRQELSSFEIKCEGISQDASILVGDGLGQGHDQVVVLASNTAVAYLNVYGSSNGNEASIHHLGGNKFSLKQEDPLFAPILTAFVPTTTAHRGLDVLQISRHQKGNSASLVFRTYLRGNTQPNKAGEDVQPYDQVKEVTWKDHLASSNPDQYYSIKWMPARYKSDSEAEYSGLLEIFSWYGVLGARLFGSSKDSWAYELVGQLPYLGQTSIGAGLGCYGDWGHGFVTWAEENEWVDINMFRRSDKQNTAAGLWGMTWDDVKRPSIRGWEVEKRPFR